MSSKVITQELQYYLGPQATVRPYTLEEQIDDICRKSKDLWDRQAAVKVQQNPEKLLKRPLHQPVIVSRGSSRDSQRRYYD
ncbi:hypothetical protein LB507_007196 [Fusarium sp. FIESC RH6]|nr:hypothetical protein LB507_007196 [Fusarium sp. FIESC RH6]